MMEHTKRCDNHELGPVYYSTEKCPLCQKLEEWKKKQYELSSYSFKPRTKPS